MKIIIFISNADLPQLMDKVTNLKKMFKITFFQLFKNIFNNCFEMILKSVTVSVYIYI